MQLLLIGCEYSGTTTLFRKLDEWLVETIGKKANPHRNEVVPEQDIPLIIDRFQEEFNDSKIKNKISIDTTSDTIDQSVKKLAKKIEPYLNHEDRLKLLLNQLK